MLQRSLARCVQQISGTPPIAHEVHQLTLDVILRRMQSSSIAHGARSLEAHFGFQVGDGKDGIRSLLSVKFNDELHRDASEHHLSLEDLSLLASNGVRHGLDVATVERSVDRLLVHLNSTQRRSSSSFLHLHVFNQPMDFQQLEALIRVMEAVIDRADANEGCRPISIEQWAALMAVAEQQWDVIVQGTSVTSLLVQFLALGLGAPGLTGGEPAKRGPSSLGKTFGAHIPLHLTTDHHLFLERCYRNCERAVSSIASIHSDDPQAASLSRPSELGRLCKAAYRIRQRERDLHAKTMEESNTSPLLKIPSSLWQAGRRGGGIPPADRTPLFHLLGQCIAHLASSRQKGSKGPQGPQALHAMTLHHLPPVFSVICDCGSAEELSSVSLKLCEVLRTHWATSPIADVHRLDSLLRIGEMCTQRPEGTQRVMAEVFKCLQASASFVASVHTLCPPERFDPQRGGGEEALLFPRACELVETAFLTTQRKAARATLFALTRCLTFSNGPLSHLRTPPAPKCDEALSSQAQHFCHTRYGTLLLCEQVLLVPGGYLSPSLDGEVTRLVHAFPFTHDGRRGLAAAVRGLHVMTTQLERDITAPSSKHPCPQRPATVLYLLEQLRAILHPSSVESASRSVPRITSGLTSNQKRTLRHAVRVLQRLSTTTQVRPPSISVDPPASSQGQSSNDVTQLQNAAEVLALHFSDHSATS